MISDKWLVITMSIFLKGRCTNLESLNRTTAVTVTPPQPKLLTLQVVWYKILVPSHAWGKPPISDAIEPQYWVLRARDSAPAHNEYSCPQGLDIGLFILVYMHFVCCYLGQRKYLTWTLNILNVFFSYITKKIIPITPIETLRKFLFHIWGDFCI